MLVDIETFTKSVVITIGGKTIVVYDGESLQDAILRQNKEEIRDERIKKIKNIFNIEK